MSTQSVLFDAPGPRARRRLLIGNIVGVLVVLGIATFVVYQLQVHDQLAPEKWAPMIEARTWLYYFLPGLQNTLVAAAYSIVLALVFGLLFGIGRLASNRAIRWFCGVVVEFFRAVPVLIMMIGGWIFVSQVLRVDPSLGPLLGVVIGLTLYNGSVIAELVRSGVHGLPKGQREAALAIGMTRSQSIRSIELPQALMAMLPSLVSQFVVVLKDSALGAIITYSELLRSARLIGADSPFPVLQSFFVIGVIYIVLNATLAWVAGKVARRIGGRTSGKTQRPGALKGGVDVTASFGVKGR
ncbi:amino acid ABC transporter permease [Ruania zhangjianzhongii]|uniref:amino acid ABC transporter permease n=1 Tax=Ruania zhangjianzhongii TaxID=2603206 RepID=UPI0011CBA755|nr:amino acid ABC transporter permease [Ruania zhangjianzhongii]